MAASRVGVSFKPASRRLISSFQSGIVGVVVGKVRSLLTTQRNHWVNLRRPLRWRVARYESSKSKQRRRSYKGHWIKRRETKEETGQQAADGGGQEQTDDATDGDQRHSLPQHQTKDTGVWRPQSQANSDLARAARDCVRRYAVNT